ncbi:hypothetical protein PV755_14625 [Streptomyces caniscabiei]|uniref:Uncharacterized protein n=1 Tax=Streptomyces caniscabiei TaxID=2746961 RepID=A0A927L3V7_9ACTN|nr:hypothetical protein [Streptomyces caniscabiei]MBD9725581.1 hypothetical protein [Streptomyces caniscabiei]MDX3510157.1 hypothetical protein [Streptomyces caniscabiei]MDX3720920.1 hypothetical protein [Streptomyces caniscabiei]MDX3729011.1 hypothetical protein [Streptomyces caniscabiei]WEO27773.1 hypothetical protein IHE65_34025 [Streptomyces caniscabiei]
MRRLAYLFGGAAAVGAGVYFVVYLYRWQWQRAILSGVLLLIVGVLLLGLVLLGRLARIEERIRESDRRQQDALARLRQTHTRERDDRFRWLEDPAGRTYVFVPVLLITGVVLSGIAWLVQRIASVTARPAAERHLAGRLAVLTSPDSAPDADLEDTAPPGIGRRRGRAARLATVGVGVGLLVSLVVGLADLTQTRKEERNGAEATSVLVKVDMRGVPTSAERQSMAASQAWERCRNSTSVPLRRTTLGELGDGLFAGVVRPSLTDHDRLRLRGCLEDADVDRAHLTVVGIGDADEQ